MAHLLIIHHTPSPHCQELFEAVVAGATDPEIEGVEVVRRPALTVSPVEMLEADGYLLGSPANLGYISGALKLAFDQSYYQLLDSTRGRQFERICQWFLTHDPVFAHELWDQCGRWGADESVDLAPTASGSPPAAPTTPCDGGARPPANPSASR